MTAYNINYVEDIAELQRELFEYVADTEEELDYEKFVDGYMNCKYRILLDKANPRVSNMTLDELISYLENDCSELFVSGNTNVDILQSGWIGRMYSLLQYHLNISSKQLYEKLPLERMQMLFIPLHTVGEEVALEKLLKII